MNVRASLLLCIALSGCGQAVSPLSTAKEKWDKVNDPTRLPGAFEVHLDKLPLNGRVDTQPWSDTYWPSFKGGTAYRWHGDKSGFGYTSPTKTAALAMSQSDLAGLSPAEKYDILIGRFDYALVKYEQGRTSPDRPSWEGICHGWAPAALLFTEPHAVLVAGANGVKVPFGASDVKALLSLFEGNLGSATTFMLGARCNDDMGADPAAGDTARCRDVNAGSFHIILANYLGIKNKGFVADVTRDHEVWNQPVHAFSTKVVQFQGPSDGAAEGTVKEAVMTTRMAYAVETNPLWDSHHSTVTETYRYRLELNKDGEIIGGEWLQAARPDFLWTKTQPAFTGYMAQLKAIYEQSIAATPPLDDPRL